MLCIQLEKKKESKVFVNGARLHEFESFFDGLRKGRLRLDLGGEKKKGNFVQKERSEGKVFQHRPRK